MSRGVAKIFSGAGTPGHVKAITRPPQGLPGEGAKAPWTVAKFHISKRCKVLENESIFQKYQHLFLAKSYIFSKNNFENWTYFTRISEFFRTIIYKISISWEFYKKRRSQRILISSWEIYQTSSKRTIGNWMKICEIFGDNQLKSKEKFKIIKRWRMIAIEQGKLRTCLQNMRVWNNNEENLEKFQENFENFWSKSLWKIDFFHIFD